MTDSLEAIALRPSIIRKNWLPLKMAVQEVLAFEQRFGKKHLLLACHAALPSYLTPELLNLVRLNFLDNENIATIAEADFLLSPLCRPVDERLFEVEPVVREVLLVSLKRQYGKEEGEKRLVDLAAFLRRYLAEKSHQITRSDVLNTMRWIASSYLEPDFVIQELRKQFDESLSDATDVNEALIEQAELVVLLEKIAEPLERSPMQREYQYLMHDSHVVAQMLYTDEPTDEVFATSEKAVHKRKLASLISPSLLNWIVASAPPISDERVIEPASRVESATPVTIDSEVERLLSLAGWTIQDYDSADIRAKRGVAIRNLPIRLDTDETQSVDYLLFVDQQAAGIVKVIKQWDDHNLPESPTKRNVLEANLDHLIETVTLQLQPQPRAQATASTLQQLSTFIPNDVTLADLVVGWRTLSHSAQNEEEEIATTQRRSTCSELANIASQSTTERGNIEQAIKTWRIWHNAFENSDDPRQVAMANTFARELSELETASQVIFVIEDGENRISLEKPTRLSQSIPMLDGEKLRLNSIPFIYETNTRVSRVRFTNYLDSTIRTRSVFAFHRPETLGLWLQQVPENVGKDMTDLLRARLRRMPQLSHEGLRDVQYEAITNLEKSLAEGHPRILIQVATDSGKTHVMVSSIYRLLKFGGAQRILVLMDRVQPSLQVSSRFEQFRPPDDTREFTQLYSVQYMQNNNFLPNAKVCIMTIQRLYSMLSGNLINRQQEEESLFELGESQNNQPTREICYNPEIPIETFDIIVIHDCHRSIYRTRRSTIEYFDAFVIGLTATPDKRTLELFNQNLVMESETKPHVFVAMPFKKDMDDVFYYGIQQPARNAGFICERVDQEAFIGNVLEQVKHKIATATVVIAVLNGADPNVYVEVGYAWAKGRPTILLIKDDQELRSDLYGERYLKYDQIQDLAESLKDELNELKSKGFI